MGSRATELNIHIENVRYGCQSRAMHMNRAVQPAECIDESDAVEMSLLISRVKALNSDPPNQPNSSP